MNTSQIDSFLTLCETSNFSKAAMLLHISQSVVSRHIQQLEDELGLRLFSRSKHSVFLTDAGEIMKNHFLSCRREYQVALKHAQRVAEPYTSTISIRLLDLFETHFILNVISSFSGATFQIARYASPCHAEHLLSGIHDVGISFNDEFLPNGKINYHELLVSRDTLISSKSYCTPHHSLPKLFLVSDDMKKPANAGEKRAEKLHLEDYCIKLVPNMASALAAVESGLGFTIVKDVSLSYIQFEYKRILLNSWQSIGLSWIDDPTRPHIERFAKACIAEYEKSAGASVHNK